MEVVEALEEALWLQVDVVGRIEPSLLEVMSRCSGWSVRDVLSHSVAVTAKFTAFASGETDEPRTPRCDLLGDDVRGAMSRGAEEAIRAWRGIETVRVCRLPFGAFSTEQAAGINLFDVLAHTWDIASVLSIDLDEGLDVWTVGLHAAAGVIGSERDQAHYGAEVEVDGSVSPMVRFLAFLGRSVNQ